MDSCREWFEPDPYEDDLPRKIDFASYGIDVVRVMVPGLRRNW